MEENYGFKIFIDGEWIFVNEEVWKRVKIRMNLRHFWLVYNNAKQPYKDYAFKEMKLRWELVKHDYILKELWKIFLKEPEPVYSFALEEILARSEEIYKHRRIFGKFIK
ncbi:hypothetical protein HZB05_02700 [Candidatus Wolfebacteria bacterium]|nr:hypothetical protein [Candidatus Wolfebacteria bacterium]